MSIEWNRDQRKALSNFFIGIAVGWFLAIFGVPVVAKNVSLLTLLRFTVSMIGALYIALYLLKEEE